MCKPARASSPTAIPTSSSRSASTRPRRCFAPPRKPSASHPPRGADNRSIENARWRFRKRFSSGLPAQSGLQSETQRENAMNRLGILGISMVAALGFALAATPADARQKTWKEQIVGTWVMVSNVTTAPDGSKTDTYGPNPKAIAMFQKDGRMAVMTARADLPKFASGSRSTGTPDENKAVVQGTIAYFGTSSVSEKDKTLTLNIDGSTYPNWAGTSQTRSVALADGVLTQFLPIGSGGGTVVVKFQRVK